MVEYITRNNAVSAVCFGCNIEFSDEPCEPDVCKIRQSIMDLPAADVVLTAVMEQIKWERDIAIEQLASYGVCLGEKKELVEVKHGYWKDRYGNKYDNHLYECSVCGKEPLYEFYSNELQQTKTRQVLSNGCPHCGAKMDGRRDT